jgi:predicted ATP-binding protein involved in virulence
MRVDSIRLDNYRCFKQIRLTFHPQLTVIVAKNGGGKTAVLDAVAFAFGLFVTSLSTTKGGVVGHTDVQRLKVRATPSNEMEFQYPLCIETHGFFDGLVQTWKRELKTMKSNPTNKDAKVLSNFAKKVQLSVQNGDLRSSLPLIVHYGTGRLWKEKSLTDTKKADARSRLSGYLDCLDPTSSYKWFVDWLEYMTLAEIQYKQKNSAKSEFSVLLEAIRQPINQCLMLVGWGHIEYDLAAREVTATSVEKGILPVSLLSDGIRNMIGLVADIAYRIVKLNPHLGQNAAQETTGIVLIDEVDMHLHPEWQQLVLLNLTKAFPKLQFIVTTHSPQVLTTVLPECIRVINWTDGQPIVEIPLFSLGAKSSQLLEDIQKYRLDQMLILHRT